MRTTWSIVATHRRRIGSTGPRGQEASLPRTPTSRAFAGPCQHPNLRRQILWADREIFVDMHAGTRPPNTQQAAQCSLLASLLFGAHNNPMLTKSQTLHEHAFMRTFCAFGRGCASSLRGLLFAPPCRLRGDRFELALGAGTLDASFPCRCNGEGLQPLAVKMVA